MYRSQSSLHLLFADSTIGFSTAITPLLPIFTTVLGGLVVGGFAVWNRRRGATETRAPDVNEIWLRQAQNEIQLDTERRLRRRMEDMFVEIRDAFRGYVNRVQAGGSIELTERERKLYEVGVPTYPTNTQE